MAEPRAHTPPRTHTAEQLDARRSRAPRRRGGRIDPVGDAVAAEQIRRLASLEAAVHRLTSTVEILAGALRPVEPAHYRYADLQERWGVTIGELRRLLEANGYIRHPGRRGVPRAVVAQIDALLAPFGAPKSPPNPS